MANISKPLEPIEIELIVKDCNGNAVLTDSPYATIKSSDQHFNGLFFTPSVCKLSMAHAGDGKYTLTFVPEKEGIYAINAISDEFKSSVSWTHTVSDENSDSVAVSHDTIRTNNGDDTVTMDNNGRPLMGVSITCYDFETKNVVAVSQSDMSGHWSMIVPRGRKIFLFQKQGHESISVERVV